MNTQKHNSSFQEDDSIDIIALLTDLWLNKKLIVKTTFLFSMLGILIAILSPIKYSASTVFVPQVGSDMKAPGGSISSLASLAGINLSQASQGNDLSPLLYPNLSSNIPFKLALLSQTISTSSQAQMDIQSYLLSDNTGFDLLGTLKKYTIGLPGILFSKKTISDTHHSNIVFITDEQKELIDILSEKYSVSVNEKEGYVSVSALDKDPVVAFELVRVVTQNLQDQIIQKRLEKVRNNLNFTQNQYLQKKKEFEEIQDRLALFKDRNQNISNALFLNELERIQAQYSVALNVVTGLAGEVESAKLQVNKDTPIFSVVEPVVVPNERDSPKRSLIVLIWTFLGLVLSMGYVLIKNPVVEIVQKITKSL